MSSRLSVGWASHIEDGNKLWLISYYYDYLLEIDMDSYRMINAYDIPENTGVLSYIGMAKVENSIYLFPYCGNDIYKFDTAIHEFKKIEFPFKDDEYENAYMKFNIVASHGGSVVFVGQDISGVFVLDSNTDTISRFPVDIGSLKRTKIIEDKLYFLDGYCVDEELLYIPLYMNSSILKLDMSNLSYEHIELGSGLQLHTIDKIEEGFLLTTTDNKAFRWLPHEKDSVIELPKIADIKSSNERLGQSYRKVISINKKIYFFTLLQRKIYVLKDGCVFEIKYESSSNKDYVEGITPQHTLVFRLGNDIYFQLITDGQMYKLNTEYDAVDKVDIDISKEISDEMAHVIYMKEKEKIMIETDVLNLKKMINWECGNV